MNVIDLFPDFHLKRPAAVVALDEVLNVADQYWLDLREEGRSETEHERGFREGLQAAFNVATASLHQEYWTRIYALPSRAEPPEGVTH